MSFHVHIANSIYTVDDAHFGWVAGMLPLPHPFQTPIPFTRNQNCIASRNLCTEIAHIKQIHLI